MSDIKLVIKIPKEQYSLIMQSHRSDVEHFIDKEAMMYAIKNGIPLPKGHGDLVDASKIQFKNTDFDTYGDSCRAFDAIDLADTIIEADKEK